MTTTKIKALVNIRGSASESGLIKVGAMADVSPKMAESLVRRKLAIIVTPEVEKADKLAIEAAKAQAEADKTANAAAVETSRVASGKAAEEKVVANTVKV